MKRPGEKPPVESKEVAALRRLRMGVWPSCPQCGGEMVVRVLNCSGLSDDQLNALQDTDPQAYCNHLILPPVFECDACEGIELPVVGWPETKAQRAMTQDWKRKSDIVSEHSQKPGASPFRFCPHCGGSLENDRHGN